MKAVFVELPAFERHRAEYLDDGAFRGPQDLLMYDKDEMADLTLPQRRALKAMIKAELGARKST